MAEQPTMDMTPLITAMERKGITQKLMLVKLRERNRKFPKGSEYRVTTSPSWLSMFITGKFVRPDWRKLLAVAEILDVSIDYLVGRTKDPTFYGGLKPKIEVKAVEPNLEADSLEIEQQGEAI